MCLCELSYVMLCYQDFSAVIICFLQLAHISCGYRKFSVAITFWRIYRNLAEQS